MKIKLLFASIFAILAGTSLNAQWFQQTSGTVATFNSIHCLNDSTCYAVGTLSNVRKTVNGGATAWTVPGGSAGVASKLSVKMYDKDVIIMGQVNGTFRKTTTGSTTSTWSSDIFGGNTGFGIYDITMNSATDFVAVGGSASNPSAGGHITTTSVNAGATWTPINVSGEPTFYGMQALTTTTFVACGGMSSVYKSTDGGATWTAKRTGSTIVTLYDINFPTPSIGYVVGGSSTTLNASTVSRVFKTTDGGETWASPANTGLLTNTLYGVHFINQDTGYVVGNGGVIQVTLDGGATWTAQISPVTTDLNKIYFPSDTVGYICGEAGVILKTTNGGFIGPLVVNAGNDASVCPGFCATIGGTSIASGATPPYTYSWMPGGNTDASMVVCPTSNSTYTLTVSDANSVTTVDSVSDIIHTVAPVSFSGLPAEYCLKGTAITLTGSPSGGTFFGTGVSGTSFNPTLSGSGTHSVSYTYTDNHGCIDTSSSQNISVTPLPSPVSLCIVTVDSVTSSTNILVWTKPVATYIDSFRIYKNVSSVMTYLGSVAYAATPKFIDTGVNPKTSAYQYAISILDTCGSESALGSYTTYHTTILLDPPGFTPPSIFTLKWSDYLGFPVAYYQVWRDGNNSGNWVMIKDSIDWLSPNKYIDSLAPTKSARYRIEVQYPAGCSSMLSTTYSNISDDQTGVSETTLDHLLNVYPNPNHGTFTFELAGIKYKTASIKMYSMLGKLVYESTFKNQRSEISIPGIAPGIYQLQVVTDMGVANKKITIQ